MAAIVKTPSGCWKALIREQGWPTVAKTFCTKRDAQDWSRRTEDSMVRGVYIERALSERLTLSAALDRDLAEVTPTKRPATQRAEQVRAEISLTIAPDLLRRVDEIARRTGQGRTGIITTWRSTGRSKARSTLLGRNAGVTGATGVSPDSVVNTYLHNLDHAACFTRSTPSSEMRSCICHRS